MPQAPPPPEVHQADEAGAALTVRWQGMGPSVSGYVVELQASGSEAIERYTRSAPMAAGILELCVGGLATHGCYAAQVRSISQSGCESLPSGLSNWLTLSAVRLPLQQCNTFAVPPLPAPVLPADMRPVETHTMPPAAQLHIGAKDFNMASVAPAPEITGHEDEMLILD